MQRRSSAPSARPLRVLHVTPSFFPAVTYGGPTVSTLALTRALAALGLEVRVVTTDADGMWDVVDREMANAGDQADNPEIRRCGRDLPPDISAELVGEVLEGAAWADVVHVTAAYSFSTIPALGAARVWKRPCVWSPRGSFQAVERRRTRTLKRAWRWWTRATLPRASVIHATSRDEADATCVRYPGLDVVVVPNGVDLPVQRERKRRGRGLEVLFLGRIDAIKNIDLLLAGVGAARASGLDVRLTVAGEGPEEVVHRLKRLASELGIAGSVIWCGQVAGEEKEMRFAEADLLALVSKSENFGMVVAESLARSVPVVAGSGTPWANVEARGCGFFVASNAISIAEAFWAASRAELTEMGSQGRAWMAEEFSWEGRAKEMTRVYEELVCGTRG